VLYDFQGSPSDGEDPSGNLTIDTSGNLYGTTVFSGGGGTVFKLLPEKDGSYTESVLDGFAGDATEGYSPSGSVIMDGGGNLYGVTSLGGLLADCYSGCGTVFKLSHGSDGSYTHSLLYGFQGGASDGESPDGSLIMDSSGNFYGATYEGGLTANCTYGCGTIFKLTLGSGGNYTETLLYSFQGGTSDGASPNGSLIVDDNGSLYGTTYDGGLTSCPYGCGTVFKLTPSSGGSYSESLLYTFQGDGFDGAYPAGGLIVDDSGNLYGTTGEGGGASRGTVFRLAKNSDGSYTESLLHIFQGGITDGASPNGGLVMDGSGNLYGTTTWGGGTGCTIGIGCGTVFILTPGSEGSYAGNLLYSFPGGITDGASPNGGLVMDSSGNLYGTTISGGNCTNPNTTVGCGTVFEIKITR
jgi:uncharacterized repeat protein (TIGR03803 family)